MKYLSALPSIAIALWGFYEIYNVINGNILYHRYVDTHSMCDFKYDTSIFHIVYSKSRNAYAVSVKRPIYGTMYLWEYGGKTDDTYLSVTVPAMFSDTCQAKYYICDYLNKDNNKVTDFKNLR